MVPYSQLLVVDISDVCRVVDHLEGESMGLNVLATIFVIISTLVKNDFQSVHIGMPFHHSLKIPCKQICRKYHSRTIWKCSTERCSKARKIRFQETESKARYQLPGDLSRCESDPHISAISVGEQCFKKVDDLRQLPDSVIR